MLSSVPCSIREEECFEWWNFQRMTREQFHRLLSHFSCQHVLCKHFLQKNEAAMMVTSFTHSLHPDVPGSPDTETECGRVLRVLSSSYILNRQIESHSQLIRLGWGWGPFHKGGMFYEFMCDEIFQHMTREIFHHLLSHFSCPHFYCKQFLQKKEAPVVHLLASNILCSSIYSVDFPLLMAWDALKLKDMKEK